MLEIERYMPHRPPMRLLERLVDQDALWVITSLTITPDSSFFDPSKNGVPAWVGIEYMAQSAAVWLGLRDERMGQPITPAFLVSSRDFTAYAPTFNNNEQLTIRLDVQLMDIPIVSFVSKIFNPAGVCLAEGAITAYRPDNVWAYLRGETS